LKKKVKVEDSIGTILAHDLTKIVPGQFKGRRFKKGHVIRAEDLPELLNMGKEHLYVLELGPNEVHEDEAALRLARAAVGKDGRGLELTEPKEGKVNILAARNGLLKVDYEILYAINTMGAIIMATLHNNCSVKKGQEVAGTRIIPLTIAAKDLAAVEAACTVGVLKLKPYHSIKVGLVTTGNEVYKGRLKDAFAPVVGLKFGLWGRR
jgi:hypothetical protein